MSNFVFAADEFYLVYFDVDETVTIVKKKSIVEATDKVLTAGDICHVKESRGGRKTFEAWVVPNVIFDF